MGLEEYTSYSVRSFDRIRFAQAVKRRTPGPTSLGSQLLSWSPLAAGYKTEALCTRFRKRPSGEHVTGLQC